MQTLGCRKQFPYETSKEIIVINKNIAKQKILKRQKKYNDKL